MNRRIPFETLDKPARYLGIEAGAVHKHSHEVDLHLCLAFPDIYEVGMSHLGLQILYHLANALPGVWAERVYLPLPDFERFLRSESDALCSLEAQRPLHDFDIVGFSLQYELSCCAVLSMLDLGRIPLAASARGEQDPLVIAGGPVTSHPEPLADFFDAFLIGDGEELLPEFLNVVRQAKKNGAGRAELLRAVSALSGVYVPSAGARAAVTKRTLLDLTKSPCPTRPLLPLVKPVHDRFAVEIMRGCLRGCRFCQAGYLYRPQRERTPRDILEIVEQGLAATGYEEVSLLSLSSTDYSQILPLLRRLNSAYAGEKLSIALPSSRVDALAPEILDCMQSAYSRAFTIAPEAGTQRLRNVINKGVTEEELLTTCENAFRRGCTSLKLYFMIGLPTETEEDVQAIADLAAKVKRLAPGRCVLTVSVSTHIPKPHTPFQWARQEMPAETEAKQKLLAVQLKKRRINFRYHHARASLWEGVLARGDRSLGALIRRAYELGCRNDGWENGKAAALWEQAADQLGFDTDSCLRERGRDQALPWEFIDTGLSAGFLWREWERARAEKTTADCLKHGCPGCGVCSGGVDNVLQHNAVLPSPRANAPKDAAAPAAADRVRIRLQYCKLGPACFISHLELINIFIRALRSSGLPLVFSAGFTPRPKIGFGPPLQIGIESECEYFDILLTGPYDAELLMNTVNKRLPQGVQLLSAETLNLKAAPVQEALREQHFSAVLREGVPDQDRLLNAARAYSEDWQSRSAERVRKDKSSRLELAKVVLNFEMHGKEFIFGLIHLPSTPVLKPLEALSAVTGVAEDFFAVRKTKARFSGADL